MVINEGDLLELEQATKELAQAKEGFGLQAPIDHTELRPIPLYKVKNFYSNLVAGTDIAVADANSSAFHNSTTYTKVKEITIWVAGEFRITYSLAEAGGSDPSKIWYGKVYVNGVAVWTENDTDSGSSFTEDVTLEAGDKVQLYTKINDSAYWVQHNTFEVSCNRDPYISYEVNLS